MKAKYFVLCRKGGTSGDKKGDILNTKWNMHECIRYFCCQELCPVGSIETMYSTLGKLFKLKKR